VNYQIEALEQIEAEVLNTSTTTNCPLCFARNSFTTNTNLEHLTLVGSYKKGVVRQCPSCKSMWFRLHKGVKYFGYTSETCDFMIEWVERDLQPGVHFQNFLRASKNIASDRDIELHLVAAVTRTGEEVECGLLILSPYPPPEIWFKRANWFYYLDKIEQIKSSPYAFPSAVAKKINFLKERDPYKWVYIQVDAERIFYYPVMAGVFMPAEFAGHDVKILKDPGKDIEVKYIMEPADRGGADTWYFIKPPASKIIWGDL
jgi:hypothetical protein